MTGDTIYRPIANIDFPEFTHLKDGRPVLVLLDSAIPSVTHWAKMGGPYHTYEGFPLSYVTHFSTHDPRPICEPVAGEDDQSPEDIIAEVLSYYGWMNDKGGGEPKDYRDRHQFRIIRESAGMITALSRAGFRITK